MGSKRPQRRLIYQSVTPASNMLLKKKWDQKIYDQHRDRVLNAKPIVDDRLSLHHIEFHLQLKSNRKFAEEQKRAQIKKDNEAMLVNIMNAKGKIGPIVTQSCPYRRTRSCDQGRKEPVATRSYTRPTSANPRATRSSSASCHSSSTPASSTRQSSTTHHSRQSHAARLASSKKERRPPWL